MDEQEIRNSQPVNPRRKKRSQMQVFKEAYLPTIIVGVALLLIIIFIIGSVSRGIQKRQDEIDASIAESVSIEEEMQRLNALAESLIADAQKLASQYDYAGAIAVLDTFSGDMRQYPNLTAKRTELVAAQDSMRAWSDPSQVLNLSFQLLIADSDRAYADKNYGTAYNKNFVTTTEFTKILSQIYENGYILVSLDDFLTTETTDTGAVIYKAKTLYLPEGKKPLVLTQTNVNYNTYMIDSDGDKLPDAGGAGFASRLILDSNGKITCEMVDSSGQTVTGAYDLVPILDSFVEQHPDFSYKGAKAILAVTGYDGLFGYRTNAEAKKQFGSAAYDTAVADAGNIAAALRNSGYDIACYTYDNIGYGSSSKTQIEADLSGWTAEVLPILGNVDILAFAQNSDISEKDKAYTGEKYNVLNDAGFRYFLGFCTDGVSWSSVSDNYVRIGRILVTGANMAHNADWFTNIFDPASILDSNRGNVPQP